MLRKGRDQLVVNPLRRLQHVEGIFKQGEKQWVVSPAGAKIV